MEYESNIRNKMYKAWMLNYKNYSNILWNDQKNENYDNDKD